LKLNHELIIWTPVIVLLLASSGEVQMKTLFCSQVR